VAGNKGAKKTAGPWFHVWLKSWRFRGHIWEIFWMDPKTINQS